MKYIRSLSLNFFIKIFIKTLKSVVRFKMHKTLIQHTLNANISLLRGVHLFDRSMAQLTTVVFFSSSWPRLENFIPNSSILKNNFTSPSLRNWWPTYIPCTEMIPFLKKNKTVTLTSTCSTSKTNPNWALVCRY